jgi:hypothetical protein
MYHKNAIILNLTYVFGASRGRFMEWFCMFWLAYTSWVQWTEEVFFQNVVIFNC